MSRAKHWCFTINNYTSEIEDAIKLAFTNGNLEYVIYGREIGEEGTPHLQGFVSFKERIRRPTTILPQAHYTIARHVKNSIEYCKKDGDFVEYGKLLAGSRGKRTDLELFATDVKKNEYNRTQLIEAHKSIYAKYPRFFDEYIEIHRPNRPVDIFPLREWQLNLSILLAAEPDDRHIVFVVDQYGNKGKSWFTRYYEQQHPGESQCLVPGKHADMAYALNTTIRVLFLDAPRAKQGEYIQYDFLEEVKNGMVFSTKYQSVVKRLSKVHVVVLMNEPPNYDKLSADRYITITIDN